MIGIIPSQLLPFFVFNVPTIVYVVFKFDGTDGSKVFEPNLAYLYFYIVFGSIAMDDNSIISHVEEMSGACYVVKSRSINSPVRILWQLRRMCYQEDQDVILLCKDCESA